jgi:pilus assembly protein CpaC
MTETLGRRQICPMTTRSQQFRVSRWARAVILPTGPFLLFAFLLGTPALLAGQDLIQTTAERVITVSRGQTAILTRPDSIRDISIADPNVADFVIMPPSTVLINAIGVGSTSLIVWGRTGPARMYIIEVTADVASLQRQIDELFPAVGLSVTSTGTSVVLSGEVRDAAVVRKALELASTQGIPVVNNVDAPAPEQILLHVEFAEISRSVLTELGGDLIRLLNPTDLDQAWDEGDRMIETLSEGFVTLQIAGDRARLDAIIRAVKNTGQFRSLAQPNLVTREGEEASFLAGGEFPFPTIQGGANNNAVTIQWREFGIRLNFTPTITNSGNIRLRVAPEVSSLDFANGLTFAGFQIPALLARKVDTDVELRPGQTLAIGGLLDNIMTEDLDKIPVLGDIPILGFFFRSRAARQDRTELVVLVTPHLLDPNNLPAPGPPTGDPNDWDWDSHIRTWMEERARAGSGGATRPGGG